MLCKCKCLPLPLPNMGRVQTPRHTSPPHTPPTWGFSCCNPTAIQHMYMPLGKHSGADAGAGVCCILCGVCVRVLFVFHIGLLGVWWVPQDDSPGCHGPQHQPRQHLRQQAAVRCMCMCMYVCVCVCVCMCMCKAVRAVQCPCPCVCRVWYHVLHHMQQCRVFAVPCRAYCSAAAVPCLQGPTEPRRHVPGLKIQTRAHRARSNA